MAGYVAFSWGLFLFSVIVIALRPYGERSDVVQRRISTVLDQKKQNMDILDEELSKPLWDRFFRPMFKSLSSKVEKYTTKNQKEKSNQSGKMKKMLHMAGYTMTAGEYQFLRMIVMLGTAGAFGLISLILGLGFKSLLGVLAGVYTGYAIMRFHLSARITSRRKSMEQQLPDVLDLLSVNVEAGLGFEQALLHVIDHFEGPIIDELTITYREMTMGRPRREALVLLGERCGLNEMKTFVGAMIQAEQLGISIKNVLRAQATAMRTNRRNKVQEKAMKISVKILLPMVTLIFPVLFIVLMGPAAVKIMEMF